jgi:tetratricopeptide (TPR) repeat protein
MIYLAKVRSAPGYAKRKAIGYLFLAFISLTGIVPLFSGSIMNALNLPVPKYFTEYSLGAFVVLAIAAVLIMRNDQHQATKQKHSGTGDNVARDKVGGDKIGGDKIGGDKIGIKEVQGDDVKGNKIVYINQPPKINDPKKLTTIQRVNPDDLIGRKKDLEKLHQLLTEKKKVVVVNGMGGIGKTTLAAAYTFQYHDYYKKLVWITQSQEDITNDFVQNAELIQSLNIATEGEQADQLLGEILHALRNITERPKLLVIDNAFESLEQHLDQLPSQPEWDLLVTSRESIEGLHTMPLDFLDETEAVALFQKHCSRITDMEVIRELVNTVELHTLTIEILARTADKQRREPEVLKKALETDLKANVKTAHSKKNQIERITSYLGTIFDFSTLSEDEMWLLKNFCAIPPEFHEYDLLFKLIVSTDSDKAGNFAETLEALVYKGWLLKDQTQDSYRMHRVMVEVGIHKLDISADDINTLLGNVADELYLDETKDNPVDKFQWISFGQACLKVAASKKSEHYTGVLCNMGLRYHDLGKYQEAKMLLQTSVDVHERSTGGEEISRSHTGLALVLKALGEYQNAKALLQKAMISAEKNFGELHPSTAVTYSNLALVLQDLGEYQNAKALLQKAMISDEKNFGELHPTTAVRYSNLALVLQDLGEYQSAKELLQKAMISAEKNFGELHPTTAVSYSNLALVLQDLGEFDRAIPLAEKALRIFEQALPQGHPNIETVRGNLESIKQAAREAGAIE